MHNSRNPENDPLNPRFKYFPIGDPVQDDDPDAEPAARRTHNDRPSPDLVEARRLFDQLAPYVESDRDRYPTNQKLTHRLKVAQTSFGLCCCARQTDLPETRRALRNIIVLATRLYLEGDAALPHIVPAYAEDTSHGAINE